VKILLALGEFQAALDLGEAVLPLAVESEELDIESRIWSSLCEACVGLADPGPRENGHVDAASLAQALAFVDRAYGGESAARRAFRIIAKEGRKELTDHDTQCRNVFMTRMAN